MKKESSQKRRKSTFGSCTEYVIAYLSLAFSAIYLVGCANRSIEDLAPQPEARFNTKNGPRPSTGKNSILFNTITAVGGYNKQMGLAACKRELEPGGTKDDLDEMMKDNGRIISVANEIKIEVANSDLGVHVVCQYLPIAVEISQASLERLVVTQRADYDEKIQAVQEKREKDAILREARAAEQRKQDLIDRQEREKREQEENAKRELEKAEEARRKAILNEYFNE